MKITRNSLRSLVAQLILLLGILFLFTDAIGHLFIGEDYQVRGFFRCKLLLLLTFFLTVYLIGTDILKWSVRQLGYVGYPLYLLLLGLCGVFTASHNLLGYKIALCLTPFVAQAFKWYGKGWLRCYLRLMTRLSGGRLLGRKGMLSMAATAFVIVLSVVGIYNLRGCCHIHLREYFTKKVAAPFKEPEKPIYNSELKDRRDPYRNYPRIFNDLNDIQLVAARANGTPRPLAIQEIEEGLYDLQYITTNKLYKVDPLTHSAPYLVPKAKELLDDLGDAFQDSLYNRGYDRRHRFIVTSVYRTQDHIKRLRRSGNVNASKNSCHQYGTTVDITYVRFDKPEEHCANDPKLLQLLMQTVYDMHQAGRCYVKYERKQSCLHITVR